VSKTMQAVVFGGEGKWAVESVPVPSLQNDSDVLLKVDRVSICGTDIHILNVPPGHPATPGSILGHEYVATVEDAGSAVTHLKPGERVVVDPNITCGLCRYCRLGMSNMCENMTTLGIFRHGGMAEYNLAPARSLHKIDSAVPVERATLAEPLACVLHAFEKSQPLPGESVAIIGAGPIGLMFLMLYKTAGVGKVFVIEPREFRRSAAATLGADFTLDPGRDDCAREIQAATDVGADLVVDAAGTMLPAALGYVRRGGRVVLFGMNLHATGEINQYQVTRHEVSILGSFIQRTSFPKAVRILESGVLPLEKLVTHRLPLGETGKAWEAMRGGDAIKAVIEP